ncbi:hypothetical protein PENSUB_11229 [Penicillium subrubescens]|uniref:Uncharacterized protein n=1 Tax=Penicillium subrubescens TaxID=1316194 RepID=A0A1Q5T651_9EURO|nr:hypothetical protein PENSUB_11229 [Penicillium subrubescens]
MPSSSTTRLSALQQRGRRLHDSEALLTGADSLRNAQIAERGFIDPLEFNRRDTATAERIQSPGASGHDVHEQTSTLM